jgi:hypothetical protein
LTIPAYQSLSHSSQLLLPNHSPLLTVASALLCPATTLTDHTATGRRPLLTPCCAVVLRAVATARPLACWRQRLQTTCLAAFILAFDDTSERKALFVRPAEGRMVAAQEWGLRCTYYYRYSNYTLIASFNCSSIEFGNRNLNCKVGDM